MTAEAPRCCAPLDSDGRDAARQLDPETAIDVDAIPTCCADATTTREMPTGIGDEVLTVWLCAAHAAELDAERLAHAAESATD